MSNTTNTAQETENQSFASMLEESISKKEMRPGELITAEVVSVQHSFVVVNEKLFLQPHFIKYFLVLERCQSGNGADC